MSSCGPGRAAAQAARMCYLYLRRASGDTAYPARLPPCCARRPWGHSRSHRRSLSTISTGTPPGTERLPRGRRRTRPSRRFWMSWSFWTWILCAAQRSLMNHGCMYHQEPQSPQMIPSHLCSGAGRFWTVPNRRWRLRGDRCPSDWNKSPGGVAHCPALPPPPPPLLPVLP